MSREVYNRRRTRVQGVLHSDNAYIIFPTSAAGGGVSISAAGVTNLSCSYSQPTGRYFDLQGPVGGMTPVFLVVGRGSGSASVSHLVGPAVSVKTWYEKYGDACNACANELGIVMRNGNCCPGATTELSLSYQLFNIVMQAMNFGMGSENTAIMHSITLMFLGAEYN